METNTCRTAIMHPIFRNISKDLGMQIINLDYLNSKTLWFGCGKDWIKSLLKDILEPDQRLEEIRIDFICHLIFENLIKNIDIAEKDPEKYPHNIFILTANPLIEEWKEEDAGYVIFRHKVKEIISNYIGSIQ